MVGERGLPFKKYLYLDLIHHRPKKFHPMTIIDHIQIQFNLDHLINTNSYLRTMTPAAANSLRPESHRKGANTKHRNHTWLRAEPCPLRPQPRPKTQKYTRLRAESWPPRPQPRQIFLRCGRSQVRCGRGTFCFVFF